MKGRYWILGGLGLALVSIVVYLVFYANGWYYLRALQLIASSPEEQRSGMRVGLFASEDPNMYGGIIASVTGDRLWVWGRTGLKSFTTDGDTIYMYKDICSAEARAKTVDKSTDDFGLVVDTDLAPWKANLKAGDYVVVRKAVIANGGR